MWPQKFGLGLVLLLNITSNKCPLNDQFRYPMEANSLFDMTNIDAAGHKELSLGHHSCARL